MMNHYLGIHGSRVLLLMVAYRQKLRLNGRRTLLLIAAAVGFLLLFIAALIFFISRTNSSESSAITPLPDGMAPQALRLMVRESGIAVVTAEQLAAANLLTGSLQTDKLNLMRDGQPVPYWLQGEALYFYAQAITQTLEMPAVYWLTTGEGTVMATRSAKTEGEGEGRGRVTYLWEENNVFVSLARSEDVWFARLINAGETAEVTLTGIRPLTEDAVLTVQVWSNNESNVNPDHHLLLYFNGEQVGEHYWDGKSQETISVTVAGTLLRPTDNRVTIDVPGDTGALGEQVYLDWVRLEYTQPLDLTDGPLLFTPQGSSVQLTQADGETVILDISHSDQPVLLTDLTIQDSAVLFAHERNARYAAANPAQAIRPHITLAPRWESSLTDAAAGVDYLVIYAPEPGFRQALQPLLDHRQNQALTVLAVDVSQVYDEFSFGRPTPDGIREFLLYAAANWNPAPRFVLLVGDSSYDFHNFTGGKNQDLLPSPLVFTDFMGYVASDAWYVIPPDGPLAPQTALGRFPAQTATQLETMVAKTLIYERDRDLSWAGRALLVSDNEPYFDTSSDKLADALVESGFDPHKLYMTQQENIREGILTAINDGVGLVNYVGHGSVEVWGAERVLTAADATTLRNRGRFPIFTTFTCLNGYFNHPDVDALAETLLTAPNGGIVAAVAPSSRTTTHQQFQVADVFFAYLLTGEAATLGEALQIGKQENADNHSIRDVIYSYNLLGDPALQFHTP